MSIRVLIADDHRIVREGIRALLERETDLVVIGEAENGRRAVDLAVKGSPDVLVLDVSMPDLNGMEATRQVLEKNPETRVIALSIHSDRRYVLEMFRAGASGYLLKDCASEDLVRAIRSVQAGQTYLSPNIAGVLVENLIHGPSSHHRVGTGSLSPREREVLQLLAEGWSTKEVASKLHVSVKTIETHRRQIMQKLDIHTLAGLTKFAVREGLTSLES